MTKVKLRFVTDHKTGKCWFEEAIRDQWHRIECTVMSGEGNSRFELQQELKRRRERELFIERTYGEEFEMEIS